jgi:hypothetical protein
MCPACFATISIVIAGVLSTGGVTAIAAKTLGRTKERMELERVVEPGASGFRTADEKEKQK